MENKNYMYLSLSKTEQTRVEVIGSYLFGLVKKVKFPSQTSPSTHPRVEFCVWFWKLERF